MELREHEVCQDLLEPQATEVPEEYVDLQALKDPLESLDHQEEGVCLDRMGQQDPRVKQEIEA